MKDNLVKEKSYSFALRIINVARWLRSRKEYDLGSQVLRAGTGIGSNVVPDAPQSLKHAPAPRN